MESKLPQPGELIISNEYLSSSKKELNELKVIQWNIERGYKLPEIIEDLVKQNADILIIQEIDIDCERSKRVDCLKELAEKLKMSYAYVSEFCELYSEVRSKEDQGGGVHGNAIFAKFQIDKEKTIAIKHKYQPVNWEKEGYGKREPRKGDRYFISTLLQINDNLFIDAYTVHLEVFCSVAGRIDQFSDLPVYAEKRRNEFINNKNNSDKKLIQIIGGDINTMAHGIARLSRKYCGNDWMRYLTIGRSEGRWWLDNALCGGETAVNNLKWWKFNDDVCNSYKFFEGFKDPFDVDKDITESNHWGLYTGKLDWIFIRGSDIKEKFMGNNDFTMSDHKYVGVIIEI